MAPLLNYDNMQHHPTRRLRQPQPVIAIFQIETFQPLTRTSCWKSFQITNRLLRLTEIDLPPAVEVAALLRHVPPSLWHRYCARLRAEAQRRRAATRTWSRLSDGRSKSTRTWSITTLSPWSIVFLTAALWNSVNGMAWMGGMGSTGKITDIERAWPDRLMNDANVSNQSASIDSFRLIGSGCPDALKKAEDEAISLEVITRRDIMGYNQMLASIHDWTTTLTTRVQRPIARCLKMEGPRFLNLVQDLRSSLLAAHARAARARAQVTMERNARIFLSEA